MKILDVLVLFFSGQGFFLAFLLYKQKKIKSNPWISFFIASFSLIICFWVMRWTEIPTNLKQINYPSILQLLLGPFLYMAFTGLKTKLNKTYFHFIPATLGLLLILPYWIKLIFGINLPQNYLSYVFYLNLSFLYFAIISNITYAIYVFRKSDQLEFKGLAFGLILFMVGLIAFRALSIMNIWTDRIDYILSLVIIIGFYYSGYFYFFKYHPYSKGSGGNGKLSEINSMADPNFLDDLDIFLRKNKPYLNPNYRLEQLSIDLRIPIARISDAIKINGATNFNEFINRYRIEEAKRILESSDKKITAVASESGFSNRVTLIANFKKFYDQTPGEYRKLHLNSTEEN